MSSAALRRIPSRQVAVAALAVAAVAIVHCWRSETPRSDVQQVAAVTAFRPLQLGTPHPIWVLRVGHDRRWVVACQARRDSDGDGRIRDLDSGYGIEGDHMSPYLFRNGTGDGELIDTWIEGSVDGRWVLVIRGGSLTLVDTVLNVDREFPGAIWPTLARFDGLGLRLLYVRGADARQLAIYDLAQQRERSVPSARPIGRIDPERGEPWVELRFARAAPPARIARIDKQCNPTDAVTESEIPLAPPARWLDVETGNIEDSPATIAHVADRSVTRAPDRSWRWGTTTIVPASCDGVPDALVAKPFRLVVTCRGAVNGPLEMFGPDMHATLGGSSGRWRARAADALWLNDERIYRQPDVQFVCIQPDCFALADGRRVGPETSISSDGPYVIGRSGNRDEVTDSRTEVTTPLQPFARPQSDRDRVVRIDDLVVDLSLSPPRALHLIDPSVQAIDDHGWLLTGAPPPRTLGSDHGAIAIGPLTWLPPGP